MVVQFIGGGGGEGGAVLADKVFYGQCENVEWLRMASSYIESVLICALCLKFLIRLNNMQGSTVDKKWKIGNFWRECGVTVWKSRKHEKGEACKENPMSTGGGGLEIFFWNYITAL